MKAKKNALVNRRQAECGESENDMTANKPQALKKWKSTNLHTEA